MKETPSPFNDDELTDDDRAVLQAFEAMEDWNTGVLPSFSSPSIQESLDTALDDMLTVFACEADEIIVTMQHALSQIEVDHQINPARITALQRASHKMRGTAGSLEYHNMEKIAAYIEMMAEKITSENFSPEIARSAFPLAVQALETALKDLITSGQESPEPLLQVEMDFQKLNIDLELLLLPSQEPAQIHNQDATIWLHNEQANSVPDQQNLSTDAPINSIRLDLRRVETLALHSHHLEELRTPLEGAQAQVERALQDLYTAQVRLQHLGISLSSLVSIKQPPQLDEHPTPSLIARILNEASQRSDTHHSRKLRLRTHIARATTTSQWDDLEVERFSEQDILIHSFNEAITDVALATSRVQLAFANLRLAQQEYVAQASIIRNDTLLLRLVPLNIRIPLLQSEITKYAATLGLQVQLEVRGGMVEIDQDILNMLTGLLIQLLRTCIRDTFSAQNEGGKQQSYRIWLDAQELGNQIALEIGFPFMAHIGNLDVIRESIQRLYGTISLQRNKADGVSFHLRLPRSHGMVRCLQVRIGKQYLLVPFSQIQRISDSRREKVDLFYHLHRLLNFPGDPPPPTGVLPLLLLPQRTSGMAIGVTVDEVVDAVELVIKPLVPRLQHPGITGAAIDGKGNVLLTVDLPELVRRYSMREHDETAEEGCPLAQKPRQPKILIADDSALLRQLLLQTLKDTNYMVTEARDGMEALDQLMESTPDVFLLDVEMPNLNGYDLLNIMRLYPDLASVKVVMLSARAGEKHMQRAKELGAHVYLTKPCSPETLRVTIEDLLTR